MSQAQVIRVLEKAKKPLTTKQIAARLRVTTNNVSKNIRKLVEYKEVKFNWVRNKKNKVWAREFWL